MPSVLERRTHCNSALFWRSARSGRWGFACCRHEDTGICVARSALVTRYYGPRMSDLSGPFSSHQRLALASRVTSTGVTGVSSGLQPAQQRIGRTTARVPATLVPYCNDAFGGALPARASRCVSVPSPFDRDIGSGAAGARGRDLAANPSPMSFLGEYVAGLPRCFRRPGNFLSISTSNMIQDYDPVQLWSVLVRYFLHADPYNVIFWYGWVRKWTILPRLVCIPGTLKVGWRHTPSDLSS